RWTVSTPMAVSISRTSRWPVDAMALLDDISILRHLLFTRARGETHRDRLDAFYRGQAKGYDNFRKRLLQGREELVSRLPLTPGSVWVDLGGGTGANLAMAGTRLAALKKAYVVDLCPALAALARDRVNRENWNNVEVIEADACTFRPTEEEADMVTFSYALTMIPDWYRAVENALAMLRPGGVIGVVDFYVARKYPDPGLAGHTWLQRNFWPIWFGNDNVWLSHDHLPYLRTKLSTVFLLENLARVPYFPLLRVPYYILVGKKI
ncbi:MAG: methyltransferase domain-containing protein, partial [Rectinema sp.]|nr:methyltransferase domain-containing protein [Rectinema sp.]